MDPEHREWLLDFVKKARAAEEAVSKLLEAEGMNQHHPTGSARADGVRARVDELVAYIKGETAGSGPEAKRAAALAVTNLQQGGMWARKAFTSEDFVVGDDGGSEGQSWKPGDNLHAPTEDHDGQSDP